MKGLLLSAGGAALLIGMGMAGKSVAAQQYAPLTINIVDRSLTLTAPETIVCEPDLSGTGWMLPAEPSPPTDYFDPRREYDTYWFWGDAYTFVGAETLAPLGFGNSSSSQGYKGAHTYRSSGDFTLACFVFERNSSGDLTGNVAYGERTVSVAAPNTTFGGVDSVTGDENTIFASPGGSFGNAPAGSQTTTISNVATLISTYVYGQTDPKRIILNRGESYTFTGITFGQSSGQDIPTLHIVAGGDAGANPQVTVTGTFLFDENLESGPGTKDWVLQGIDWNGPMDSVGGTTSTAEFIQSYNDRPNKPNMLLIDGGSVKGFDLHFLYEFTGTTDTFVSINDVDCSDFQQTIVGVNGQGGLVLTGSRIGSAVDARINLAEGGFNGGFPHRAHNGYQITSQCDFFVRQGWEGGPTYLSYQPCMRVLTNGYVGSELYVSRCTFEGGFGMIACGTATGSGVPQPAKIALFEHNYFFGCWQTAYMLEVSSGGTVARNNVGVYPTQTENSYGPIAFMRLLNNNGTGDGSAVNLASPIKCYGNTVVNLNTGSSVNVLTDTGSGGSFSDKTEANNVIHEPNLGVANIPDAPLIDSGDVVFTPRETGYRASDGTYPNAAAQIPGSTDGQSYKVDTGSAAIGDALTGPVAAKTLDQVTRVAPANRGAW